MMMRAAEITAVAAWLLVVAVPLVGQSAAPTQEPPSAKTRAATLRGLVEADVMKTPVYKFWQEMDALVKQIERLEAENAELRAALQKATAGSGEAARPEQPAAKAK